MENVITLPYNIRAVVVSYVWLSTTSIFHKDSCYFMQKSNYRIRVTMLFHTDYLLTHPYDLIITVSYNAYISIRFRRDFIWTYLIYMNISTPDKEPITPRCRTCTLKHFCLMCWYDNMIGVFLDWIKSIFGITNERPQLRDNRCISRRSPQWVHHFRLLRCIKDVGAEIQCICKRLYSM